MAAKTAWEPECRLSIVLQLNPRNCTETNRLWFAADDGIRLACTYKHAPGSPHSMWETICGEEDDPGCMGQPVFISHSRSFDHIDLSIY